MKEKIKNNIQVGDYIRFKQSGIISKVPNKDMLLTYEEWKKEGKIEYSNNIINLIKVGDFVNGSKVIKIDCDCYVITSEKSAYSLNKSYTDYQIKSIVTKEIFKEVEYKL